MAVPYPNINGKVLVNGPNALAAETAFNTARDLTIKSGGAGKVGFISVDGTNQLKFDYSMQPATFCNTAQEVTDAQNLNAPGVAIYDIPNQVVWVNTTGNFATDPTRTPAKDFGTGRMIINLTTGKIFYIESEGEIYWLNGVAMT